MSTSRRLARNSSGQVVPVVAVPDLEVDMEDMEDENNEEEVSETESDDDTTDSDSDSVASVGGMSIFVREESGSESDNESLLDLDEFATCNLNETTVMLHEMIDTCHDLEDKEGFLQAQEDKILMKQVKQSAKLLEAQFMPESNIVEVTKTKFRRPTTASTIGQDTTLGSDDDESTVLGSRNRTRGNSDSANTSRVSNKSLRKRSKGKRKQWKLTAEQQLSTEAMKPSLMYLAYKHTNMCAHLMQKRTEAMGLEESCISLDGYMIALKSTAEAAAANSESSFEQHFDKIVSSVWKPAPGIITVIGAFDHKEHLAKENIIVEKPVKKDIKRRQKHFDPDALIATQTEVNISKADSDAKSKANDEVVKAFRQSLVAFTAGTGKEAVNIHEFTLNTTSVRESLNNVFGVAFGVRDGRIALKQEDNQLKITPTNAPAKEEQNMANRRQCILSISAATIRQLQEIAEGETVIKPQSQPTKRT